MKRLFVLLFVFCSCSAFATFHSTIYGDWLYWKARRSGLDFLIPEGELPVFGPSKVVAVPLKYDSGYRIGWSIGHSCLDFDLGLRYTTYCTNDSKEFSCEMGNGNATRPHPDTSGTGAGDEDVHFAKSCYDMDYDVLDIELRPTYHGCYCPFIAARLGYIDERLLTTYQGIVGDNTPERTSCLFEKNAFNAYGLLAGCDFDRCLYRGCFTVGLQGRLAASVLVGHFCLKSLEETFIPDEEILPQLDVAAEWTQNVTTLEIAVGLNICVYKWIQLSVGYEMHNWLNTADFLHFSNDVLEGVLTRNLATIGFDGLYLRLSASY